MFLREKRFALELFREQLQRFGIIGTAWIWRMLSDPLWISWIPLGSRGHWHIIFAESLRILVEEWMRMSWFPLQFRFCISIYKLWRTFCHLLSDFASSVICKRLNLIRFYFLLLLLKTFYANKIQIPHKFFIIFHCHEIIHDLIFFTDLHLSAIFSLFTRNPFE